MEKPIEITTIAYCELTIIERYTREVADNFLLLKMKSKSS